MEAILNILGYNIVPIFIIVGVGYIIGKKFKMDLNTLSKLNFYVFVPTFIFTNLYTTDIPFKMVKVIIAALVLVILYYILGLIIAKIRGYDESMRRTLQNCLMFYNSGNIGLPLITLVFSSVPYIINGETIYLDLAVTTQIMVLLIQNITTNSLGFYNAGTASSTSKESIKKILSMPTIYAIPLALLLKLLPVNLTTYPGWPALNYIRQGLVPIALISLGIQLSQTKLNLKNKEVYLTVALRTMVGPIIGLLVAFLFGFNGIMGQAFFISSSVPTAVNVALIAIEYKNNEEFAAQVVMFSTLFSAVTLSVVIFISRIIFKI